MKRAKQIQAIIIIGLTILSSFGSQAQIPGRKISDFNFGWKFHKGDIADGQSLTLDDAGWRKIDLPHDWSIEGPFSKDNSSCTGYLPGGIGWYRKSFPVSGELQGGKVFISFDGVYNNSEVWINGNHLGKRPNGYISFQYDISKYLKYGTNNLLAVKVDHTQDGDSRWYTGSGIYRNVNLITTGSVHIDQWGVSSSTPEVTPEKAVLSVNSTIVNEAGKTRVAVTNTL